MNDLRPHEQLLRHEALLDLFAHLRREATLDRMATIVAERWRFCASIENWRLLYEDDQRFLVIDAVASSVSLRYVHADALGPFDRQHWSRRLPALLSQTQGATSVAGVAEHLCTDHVAQLIVLPLGERQGFGRSLLFATSSTPTFERVDRKFIEAVGAMLAGEVDAFRRQERLTATLREQTLRDGLTQIGNRKKFDEQIEIDWSITRRRHGLISMLMIDVDHFKLYNDRFGHLAGDECLKSVAKAIAGALLRPADLAARVGGEEFAVILPETNAQDACVVAERIRAAVHALAIPHVIAGQDTIVTLSIGCATMSPESVQSPEALRKAADAALYLAKHAGRDRCVQSTTTAVSSDQRAGVSALSAYPDKPAEPSPPQ